MGSLSLHQGVFPTQGWKLGLPHLPAEPQGSPRIPEWCPIPSPVDLPNPGIKLVSSALQADSLPTELSGKPSSKEQASFNFMTAVTICSDFGAQENKAQW